MKAKVITSLDGFPWVEQTVSEAGPDEISLRVTGEVGQSIRGWGGCFNEAGWGGLKSLPDTARKTVLRSLFGQSGDGCRFSFCRVPIGANDYSDDWYSHDEVDGDFAMEHFSIERDRRALLPYIREAMVLEPGLELFASPWCPPTWMKVPKVYNSGSLRWEPEVLRAYALYFRKFVEAYRAEGVRVAQVHVQNEPAADQKFPSCLWTGAQMGEFIRDYLAPEFHGAGLDTELWFGTLNAGIQHGYLPETISGHSFGAWLHEVFLDEGTRKAISGVGFQWDAKGLVPRFHRTWPGVRIMQTENECGDGQNTWDHALYVFDLIWHYLNFGAEAYIYWNMVLPPGGRSTWGWNQNSLVTIDPTSGEVRFNPEYYVIKHFAHFVPPDSVRLALAGPWSGQALAFRTPDGATVCVIANPGHRSSRVAVANGNQRASIEAPPRSVATLIWSRT